MSGLGSFSNVRFRIFCFWLLSYLWAGWAGSGRLAPKLSTPSTGSPRSGLTRQTLSWRLTFRSGSRPRESGRSRAVRGTGRWRRSSIRARGWCSWRSDAGSGWAEFAGAPLVADGVVQRGDALLLDAQDVVELAHKGNEGRPFLRGGHGETGVVSLEIDLRQPAIGRLHRRDPVRPEQRRQALLNVSERRSIRPRTAACNTPAATTPCA